jgi:aspartate/tyrosine/aromatic aminotransferase
VIMAFQGLCSGDPAKDAEPLRLMASEGLPVVLCQTFDAVRQPCALAQGRSGTDAR